MLDDDFCGIVIFTLRTFDVIAQAVLFQAPIHDMYRSFQGSCRAHAYSIHQELKIIFIKPLAHFLALVYTEC